MESRKCPYCGHTFSIFYQKISSSECINVGTHIEHYLNINQCYAQAQVYSDKTMFKATIDRCPNCKGQLLTIQEFSATENRTAEPSGYAYQVIPHNSHRAFPDYIPQQIRNDYHEAYSILQLSPKASATLSRRCIQGMIRDFWGIQKSRLIDEIVGLKDLIPTTQWQAIDALRSLGNIGAHMEKDVNVIVDVDENEAEKLIKLIEILFEQWYINRHEQEQLYNDIVGIKAEKDKQKKAGNMPAQP